MPNLAKETEMNYDYLLSSKEKSNFKEDKDIV